MAVAKGKRKERKSKSVVDLERRLAAAMEDHTALLDQKLNTWEYRRDVAYSDARCWRLRALLLQEQRQFTAAHQASKAADGLEMSASKLEKVTLGDRVFALESRLGQGRRTATVLADLEEVD